LKKTGTTVPITAAILISVVSILLAQGQPATGVPGTGSATAFPTHPAGDPTTIERGKKAYQTNCAYCHGNDARGGENGGTNILRSEYVMKDKNGESLRQFLLNSGEKAHSGVREGILKFDFTQGQASDLAAFVTDISAFIHDFTLSSRDPGRMRPPTIVVGNARAGEVYFKAKCASCHSATGDLKGIASRIPDAKNLQQTWLLPRIPGGRGGPAGPLPGTTATVTQPDGEKAEGRLVRLDDFIAVLVTADGTERRFNRERGNPKVELHDPRQPHRDLLPQYTDKDIHDVTAYLVTLE
jgi:cytochrome c oxidase cbb3-type subunit III